MIEDLKKTFKTELVEMAQRHNLIETFGDCVGMMSAALWLSTAEDKDLANKVYMDYAAKYTNDEMAHLTEMMATVVLALKEKRESFLGPVLEEIGAANTHTGQFLTPDDVAQLCSQVISDSFVYRPGKLVKVYDPTCGGGVMLIAQSEYLMQKLHIPQKDIFIVGRDLDKRSCDMTFIELSLLGYAARIDHMNTLLMKKLSPSRYTLGYKLFGIAGCEEGVTLNLNERKQNS